MSFLIYMKQALSNLFKPPVTTSYPLKPKHFLPGDRGRVVNDISQCILCGQCMRTCPAGAITVDRKTGTWTINPFACVQCADCVEVCPKKCLHMDPEAASPDVKKSEIILSVHQEEGTAKVERKVAAIAMTKNAMDDRSKIVNNIIKCIFCGQCMRNCPTGAITVDRRARTWRINLEACVNCGTCIDNCPRKCLSLGCYLGSPSEITLHGSMPPIRRKVAEVAPVAEGKAAVQKSDSAAVKKEIPGSKGAEGSLNSTAAQTAKASPAVDLPDSHIRIEAEKCLFCGKCEHNCPVGAITLDRKNRTWTIDREKCITCGVCADGCPAHCLTLADAWEAGEKKETPATYHGRVLRRPPHRPAGVKVAEVAKGTEGKAAAQKSDSAAVKKEVPGSKGAEGSLDSTAAQAAQSSPAVDLPDEHIRIEAEKCLFCGKCEHNCPVGAITLDRKNRTWTIDREKCITCGVCADGCPAHCLTLADAWEAGEKKESLATYQGKVLRRPPRRPAAPKVTESSEVAKAAKGKAVAHRSDGTEEVPGKDGSHA